MRNVSARTAAPFVLVLAGLLALGAAGGAATTGAGSSGEAGESSCAAAVGSWIDPDGGDPIGHGRVIEEMAARPVVLLGENHDSAEHHRWQLSTIAALHGRNPNMVLGFEAFPRGVQPALDRWVQGELDAEAFLDEVSWAEVWGFDPELYLPLFHFARLHRIPVVPLNVERALVARVGADGWEAVPPADRLGIGDPAPPSDAYRSSLARTYLQHRRAAERGPGDAVRDAADVLKTPEFGRFVEAQLTWDRAMAEALADASRRPGAPLVVGVIGRGHLEYGHGVPHQLEDLGLTEAAVLLPFDGAAAAVGCATELPPPGVADAVYVLPQPVDGLGEPPRPRLGVVVGLAEDSQGVRVSEVVPGSVAAAAGVAVGDSILAAAGFPVASAAELVEIVRRQAPGTWLPLQVARDGQTVDLVAKFPTRFDAS